MKRLIFYLLIFHALEIKSQAVDYYWQDYNGEIPETALPGGKDIHGKDTYIGQAYIASYGLFIGEIFTGVREMDVQCYGVQRVESGIKILCTEHKESFRWLDTNSTTFNEDTAYVQLVFGGYNYKHPKILNIGRATYNRTLRIGAVAPLKNEKVYFYFVDNGERQVEEVYEVLTYFKLLDVEPQK